MRKAFIGLFILSLCVLVQSAYGATSVSGRPCPGGGSLSYQCTDATHDGANTAITLCEDFDGLASCATSYSSTCRNTWTATVGDTDVIDFDNTAAPAPLLGTYSLRMTSTGTTGSKITAATGTNSALNLHMRVNLDTIPAPGSDLSIVSINRSTGAVVCSLGVDSATGRFQVYTTTNTVHASLAPSADTTYYVWLEYVRNTSCVAYIATTSTKPESATITGSIANDYDSASISIYVDESWSIVPDHLRVNTSAFSSNPQ